MSHSDPGIDQRIWQVVAAIPPGRVTTYGAVARKSGLARAARRVGHALRGLPSDTGLPWHRVVNAKGYISFPENSQHHHLQRERLENEGIVFRANGSIELRRYGW